MHTYIVYTSLVIQLKSKYIDLKQDIFTLDIYVIQYIVNVLNEYNDSTVIIAIIYQNKGVR